MLQLSGLWNLGERFEIPLLQNQIMDHFCTLHNEKRLDTVEFGEFVEPLNDVVFENGVLVRFMKFVLKKYPIWEFFSGLLHDETPLRRWICLNMIWGDGSGREDWKILPEANGLYVREHVEIQGNLIEF